MPGIIETGDILPVSFDVFTPAARRSDGPAEEETARLYGQIAIYTLIDGQAEEFDQLAQAVVEKVKALEPDTLAYIVHGVPSAPMQRILYEVYRDEAAFDRARPPALHPGLRRGAQALRACDERDRARRPAGEALTAGRPAGRRSGSRRAGQPGRPAWRGGPGLRGPQSAPGEPPPGPARPAG